MFNRKYIDSIRIHFPASYVSLPEGIGFPRGSPNPPCHGCHAPPGARLNGQFTTRTFRFGVQRSGQCDLSLSGSRCPWVPWGVGGMGMAPEKLMGWKVIGYDIWKNGEMGPMFRKKTCCFSRVGVGWGCFSGWVFQRCFFVRPRENYPIWWAFCSTGLKPRACRWCLWKGHMRLGGECHWRYLKKNRTIIRSDEREIVLLMIQKSCSGLLFYVKRLLKAIDLPGVIYENSSWKKSFPGCDVRKSSWKTCQCFFFRIFAS